MTRSVTITFIVFMSVAIITLLSKTYAFLGFGGSDNEASISSFVPANSIDQTSVMLAQSSMSLLGQSPSPSGVVDETVGRGLGGGLASNTRTLNNSSTLLSYDLISAVQSSSNTNNTISKHSNDLNQAIISLTQQSRMYQSQIEQSQSKLTSCSSDKKTADTAVIEAINTNKLKNIGNLIQASVTAGQCETQHRITINALTLITNKYAQAIALLTKKANLIEQHKATIAQYPEVISNPEIIQELSQISSQF